MPAHAASCSSTPFRASGKKILHPVFSHSVPVTVRASVQLTNNSARLPLCSMILMMELLTLSMSLIMGLLATQPPRSRRCPRSTLLPWSPFHLLRRAKLVPELVVLTMTCCNDVLVDTLHQVAEDARVQRHELRAVTGQAVTVVMAHLAVGCSLGAPLPGAKATLWAASEAASAARNMALRDFASLFCPT